MVVQGSLGFLRSKKTFKKAKKDSITAKERIEHGITVMPLTMKMLFLGCVKDIRLEHLVLCLPDNIYGFVHACDINEVITSNLEKSLNTTSTDSEASSRETDSYVNLNKYFSVGQFVCCSILEVPNKKNGSHQLRLSLKPADIYASLHPSDIHKGMAIWGYICSEEDHGYQVSFGSRFLKEDTCPMRVGQMGFFRVMNEVSAGRVYTLSDDLSSLKCLSEASFSSILPGNSVKALVVDNQALGDTAKVFSTFDATINQLHLENFHGCSINSVVDTRVLYVDPLTKRVGLSVSLHLKTNLVTEPPSESLVGRIVSCTVTRTLHKYGVIMHIEDFCGAKGLLTKAWMNTAMESKDGEPNQRYQKGSSFRCKVIAYNPMENVYLLTDKPMVIDLPFVTYETVSVGAVIQGEAESFKESYFLVNFGNVLRGILPVYLTPGGATNPKKLLLEHSSIKCRVLECDPTRGKLLLTALPDMVQDDTPILTSLDEAVTGQAFVGFVIRANRSYCVLKFYNGVTGLLFRKHVDATLTGETFVKSYKQGKPVRVFVLKCKSKEALLHLTTRENVYINDHQSDQQDSLRLADPTPFVTNVLSYEKVSGEAGEESLYLRIGTELNQEVSNIGRKRKHLVLEQFLSDFPDISRILVKTLKGGKVSGYDRVAILGRNVDGSLVFTTKSVFVDAVTSSQFPSKFDDLRVGQVLPGIVVQVTTNSLKVLVGYSLIGSIPLQSSKTEFISVLQNSYCVGQTVLVMVDQLLPKSKRFTLSAAFNVNSRSTHKTYCPDQLHGAGRLVNYLQERQKLCAINDLNLPKLGAIVSVVVKSTNTGEYVAKLTDYKIGCQLVLHDNTSSNDHKMMKKGRKNRNVEALVVAIDDQRLMCHVVLLSSPKKQSLLNTKDTSQSSGKNSSTVSVGESVLLTVAHVGEELVTCINLAEKCNPRNLFYILVRVAFGDTTKPEDLYVVGDRVTGLVSRTLEGDGYDHHIVIPHSFKSNLITCGSSELCKVNNINGCMVYVHVKSTNQLGRIHVSQLEVNPRAFSNPLAKISPGATIEASVVGEVEESTRHSINKKFHKKNVGRLLEMSVISNENEKQETCTFDVGSQLVGYVREVGKSVVTLMVSVKVVALLDKIELLTHDPKFDFSSLSPGTALDCVVLAGGSPNHQNLSTVHVGLRSNADLLQIGRCLFCRIIKYLPHFAMSVKLPYGQWGVLPFTEVSDTFVKQPHLIHQLKSVVKCAVISITLNGAILSTKKSFVNYFSTKRGESAASTLELFKGVIRSVDDCGPVGTRLQGYITEITTTYATVMLSYSVSSKIVGEEFTKAFSPSLIKTIVLPALVVVEITSKHNNETLSVKLVSTKYSQKKEDAETSYFVEPLVDPRNLRSIPSNISSSILQPATVFRVDPRLGLHVTLESNLRGFVPLTQLSDVFSKNPLAHYKPNQPLNVRVYAQNKHKSTLMCSMREISEESSGQVDYDSTSQLELGHLVNGYVVFVSPESVAVSFSSRVIGIIKQQTLAMLPTNMVAAFKLGKRLLHLQVIQILDPYHVEVVPKDLAKRITTSISHVRHPPKEIKIVTAKNLDQTFTISADDNTTTTTNDDVSPNADVGAIKRRRSMSPPSHTSIKQSKTPKFDTAFSEECFIRKREKEVMDGSLTTVDDHERAVIACPNDSQSWIRYVAFVVDSDQDVDKARHIVKRALNTINCREEAERLNVWLCWLNLEIECGNEVSVENVFKKGCQICDKKKFLQRVCIVFASRDMHLRAEEVHNMLIKKFCHSKKAWILYLQFLFQRGRGDEARKLLNRALRILDKRKHVECLIKTGLLEFRHGDSQRAHSIFEGVLKNYPKRTDIWFVLIDQHIKRNTVKEVRELFERLLSLGLKPKKMQLVFKKYVDFERQLGPDVGRLEHVQKKEIDYLLQQKQDSSM